MFFSSRKTVLKSWLDTSSTPCYLSSFLSLFHIATLIAPRYLVDRSRMLLPPRQLLNTWWIDRASSLGSNSLLLDTSAVDKLFLDTYLNSFLDTSRYLICQALLKGLYILPCAILFSFLRSMSICLHLFISQTPSLSLQTSSFVFFKLFQDFSSLGKFLISHSSCISCFETQVLGLLKNFRVFQN